MIRQRASQAMRMGLLGWNGRKNIGDDAMTSVLIHEADRLAGGSLFCKALADHEALPEITATLSGGRFEGYAGFNQLLRIPVGRLRLHARALLFDRQFARDLDVLVIGGGTILHTARELDQLRWIVETARRGNESVVAGALGVSLGPFRLEKDRSACKRLIESLDFVAVRDRESWEELQRLDVSVPGVHGMDLAVLMPDYIPIVPAAARRKRIGISLRYGVLSESDERLLAASLERVLERRPDLAVSLFVFCADSRDGDDALMRRLAARLGHGSQVTIEPYSSNPADFYRQISECDVMLAMRLHAAVIAYAVETPFVMLSYHPKCIGFADEVGLGRECRFGAAQIAFAGLMETLEAAVDVPARYRPELPVTVARQKARAGLGLLAAALSSEASQIR